MAIAMQALAGSLLAQMPRQNPPKPPPVVGQAPEKNSSETTTVDLGKKWTVVEQAEGTTYRGTWTRRDNNTFDAIWRDVNTNNIRVYTDVITVESIKGSQIVLFRAKFGRYYGTLSADRRQMIGFRSWNEGTWTATLEDATRDNSLGVVLDPALEEAAFAEFRVKAVDWRALAVKPPLPDAVKQDRTLAEEALQHQDFQAALNYFEKGLAIEPMWPAGQFNAASLAGDSLQRYDQAVSHMKRYLELSPDAPNAAAGRQQMALWEQKAKSAPISAPPARSTAPPASVGGLNLK